MTLHRILDNKYTEQGTGGKMKRFLHTRSSRCFVIKYIYNSSTAAGFLVFVLIYKQIL